MTTVSRRKMVQVNVRVSAQLKADMDKFRKEHGNMPLTYLVEAAIEQFMHDHMPPGQYRKRW